MNGLRKPKQPSGHVARASTSDTEAFLSICTGSHRQRAVTVKSSFNKWVWLDHKSVQDGSNGILCDVRSFKTNVKWKEVTSIEKNLDVKEVLHVCTLRLQEEVYGQINYCMSTHEDKFILGLSRIA